MAVFFDEKRYMLDEKQLANALRPQLDALVPKTLTSTEKVKWAENVMKTPQMQAMLKASITQVIQTVSFYLGMDQDMKKKMDLEIAAAPEAIKNRYTEQFTKKQVAEMKARLDKITKTSIEEFKKTLKSIKLR